MVSSASRTVRRRGLRTCRPGVVGKADGEHCSKFRCIDQRNELRSRADGRLTCGRAEALSRAGLTIEVSWLILQSGGSTKLFSIFPSRLTSLLYPSKIR